LASASMTRKELEAEATKLGIAKPKRFATKADLLAAIEAAPPVVDLDPDLFTGAQVISVYGPFGSRTMIDIATAQAERIFEGQPLAAHSRTHTVDAVERDLAELRERDAELAESSLAAAALRMAYELENPFNSATSKSQCAKALREIVDRLRELAPEKEEAGEVEALREDRDARRSAT
jgi:hypothetical protein